MEEKVFYGTEKLELLENRIREFFEKNIKISAKNCIMNSVRPFIEKLKADRNAYYICGTKDLALTREGAVLGLKVKIRENSNPVYKLTLRK